MVTKVSFCSLALYPERISQLREHHPCQEIADSRFYPDGQLWLEVALSGVLATALFSPNTASHPTRTISPQTLRNLCLRVPSMGISNMHPQKLHVEPKKKRIVR